MTKVVDITKYKKMRDDQRPKSKNEVVYSPDAKFISLGGMTLSFGGAFQRDFIKRLDNNRQKVLDLLSSYYGKELQRHKDNPEVSTEEYINTKLTFSVLESTTHELIRLIESDKILDEIFDLPDGSLELYLIPSIMFSVIHLAYTEIDLQEMIRDRWCAIDATLVEFLETLDSHFNRG